MLEGPESCSWKRPLLCPGLDYLKAGKEWGGPLHATGTGLSGARKSRHLSRRSRGLGGLVASTTHSQPCVPLHLICLPLSIHPRPLLSLPASSAYTSGSLPLPLSALLSFSGVFATHPVQPLTFVPCLSVPDCPWLLYTSPCTQSAHFCPVSFSFSHSLCSSLLLWAIPGLSACLSVPGFSIPGMKSSRTPTKPLLPTPAP